MPASQHTLVMPTRVVYAATNVEHVEPCHSRYSNSAVAGICQEVPALQDNLRPHSYRVHHVQALLDDSVICSVRD